MAKSLFGRAHEIKKNCRITIYPDGSIGEILACSMDIFVPDGWEAVNQDKSISAGCCSDNTERARRRAQKRIETLIKANPVLDVFWTLTISPEAVTEKGIAVDRTDYDAVCRKLQQWLADRVRRRGLFYVAVFEYHKKADEQGKHALHIHGVANHSAMKLEESGRKYKDKSGHWHKIYNVKDWKLGFTTAMYMYGNRDQAIKYIGKYVRKSERPVGGRWYMHSHNLSEPTYKYLNINFLNAPGEAWPCPEARCAFKKIPVEYADKIAQE